MNEQKESNIPQQGIVLPMTPIKALVKSPQDLIIFSKPKVGKTSLAALLPNSLLLNLEKNGADYVDAVKLSANSVTDIINIGNAIITANKPYKYIIIDSLTALEEITLPYAEELYSKSMVGKKWFTETKAQYGSLTNLPNGAGWLWIRKAFEDVLNYIHTLAPRIVSLAHLKDIMLEKNGVEVNIMEIDLMGKNKRTIASKSDAIGYLYRKGKTNIISFKTKDEVACGSRSAHLRDKEIVISTLHDDNTVTANWDEIFID